MKMSSLGGQKQTKVIRKATRRKHQRPGFGEEWARAFNLGSTNGHWGPWMAGILQMHVHFQYLLHGIWDPRKIWSHWWKKLENPSFMYLPNILGFFFRRKYLSVIPPSGNERTRWRQWWVASEQPGHPAGQSLGGSVTGPLHWPPLGAMPKA